MASADFLAVLMGLWLHCVQCICKQTNVGVHVQIIPLTGNVLTSCYANRQDYSIKQYAIKQAINAVKSTFRFWFSTFYSNKKVMQLSGMRLSGLYCMCMRINHFQLHHRKNHGTCICQTHAVSNPIIQTGIVQGHPSSKFIVPIKSPLMLCYMTSFKSNIVSVTIFEIIAEKIPDLDLGQFKVI